MKKNIKHKTFRFSEPVLKVLVDETQRSGKTQTQVIEDHLTWTRLFNEDAEEALRKLCAKHKLPPRRVVEWLLVKANGGRKVFSFEVPTVFKLAA